MGKPVNEVTEEKRVFDSKWALNIFRNEKMGEGRPRISSEAYGEGSHPFER